MSSAQTSPYKSDLGGVCYLLLCWAYGEHDQVPTFCDQQVRHIVWSAEAVVGASPYHKSVGLAAVNASSVASSRLFVCCPAALNGCCTVQMGCHCADAAAAIDVGFKSEGFHEI